MNITPIRVGDIVQAEHHHRGDVFFALVTEKGDGVLMTKPLNTTAFGRVRAVRSRAVVGHYRKSKASR